MSTTIAARATATVTLARGYALDITGTGAATFGAGELLGQTRGIVNRGRVGPFDRAQIVNLTAGAASIAFDTVQTLLIDARVPVGADDPIFTLDELDAIQALVSGAWNSSNSGAWFGVRIVTMRLRMTGTGTVTMDSRNAAGVITSAVYTATVSGSTLVEYAYPGDDADSIRVTLTGTATAEVI